MEDKNMSEVDMKFFKYHKESPHIFNLFVAFSKEIKAKGYKTYSMRTIMHRIRWHVDITTNDPDGFKMNNNYSSRYARMLANEYPDFKDFFKNRRMKTLTIL